MNVLFLEKLELSFVSKGQTANVNGIVSLPVKQGLFPPLEGSVHLLIVHCEQIVYKIDCRHAVSGFDGPPKPFRIRQTGGALDQTVMVDALRMNKQSLAPGQAAVGFGSSDLIEAVEMIRIAVGDDDCVDLPWVVF